MLHNAESHLTGEVSLLAYHVSSCSVVANALSESLQGFAVRQEYATPERVGSTTGKRRTMLFTG